jgi:hypothetical protein
MELSAVRYEDIYPASFKDFRKKYLKLFKKGSPERPWSYYVQFTNFMSDKLLKKPFENPDHHDPVAVYAYPLAYVLKHPADIWYGNQAKYLRVLKERKRNKTLRLQFLTESEAGHILYKMGLNRDDMERAAQLWPDRVGKGQGSIGRAFFQAMQMDMSGLPAQLPRMKAKRRELANTVPVRSGLEQTKLLRKAGFDAIEDSATNQKKAVINDREPEQIAFLHPHAFDVVEIYDLNLKTNKEGVGISQELASLKPKLAAKIATAIGDRLADTDRYNLFWTKGGREIEIRFDRPASYYENKKLGEKAHKESKLSSPHLVNVVLRSERGDFKPMAMSSELFDNIVDDIASRFEAATPIEGKLPISKATRAAEKAAASQAYLAKEKDAKYQALRQSTPEMLTEIRQAASKLGVPSAHLDYWNSTDEARDNLSGVMTLMGRHLTDETYRARTRLQEEKKNTWDWYDSYDRSKFDDAAASVRRVLDVGDPLGADEAATEELLSIYKAAMNWMLDNKEWRYQAPGGFFNFLLDSMNEAEAKEQQPMSARLVLAQMLDDVADLLS